VSGRDDPREGFDRLSAPLPPPGEYFQPAGWSERVRAPRPRQRVWLHVLLFVVTVLSTTAVGALHYAGFLSAFGPTTPPLTARLFLGGFWYSATILAILGCHELGHYYACRYYDVDATWPFFLPAPILTGTLGAFIRIREPLRSKRVLFDVGVAGPLAGFVVAVPALFVGLWLSNVARLPPDFSGLSLGEPLLFRGAAWLLWGTTAEGYSLNLHPMAFAAWFGLIATALNLFPIGQLDGGHISYAVFGRQSFYVTLGAVACAIVLTQFSASWYVWTAMIVAMLLFIGPRHPATPDEHVPLDRGRLFVAAVALLIFVLCFTPAPIEVIELLPK
jgi:membrane-associated protease RseP (regulator of RpoE activity)